MGNNRNFLLNGMAAMSLIACSSASPVQWETETEAVEIDRAMPYLAAAVGRQITVSGVPKQREGRCPGVKPLTPNDWMLTGDEGCLWVSGWTEGVRLLDMRPGRSNRDISVNGTLIQTDQGTFVLQVEQP